MRWLKLVIALTLSIVALYPVAAVGQSQKGDEQGKPSDMMKIRERIFNEHKERMMNWIQNCERWMERLKERVNTTNMGDEMKLRIQNRINNLEQQMEEIRARIANAKDYEELRNAMAESGKIWKNMSGEMRNLAYENAIRKAENIIEKLTDLADRFESAGLDVSNLRAAINEANTTLAAIKSKLENGQEVRMDFRELKIDIERAFYEAKKLVKEYRPAPKIGIANAKVNGSFELNGNLVALIKGNGTLRATGDSVASANGAITMVLRGNVTVNGEGDFKIVIHGNGTLSMSGNGSYAYKKCANEKFVTGNFTDSVTISFGC
ncbi:MAG: hypothetical protein QXQ83_01210 [Archaeoglobaceae archaeon]